MDIEYGEFVAASIGFGAAEIINDQNPSDNCHIPSAPTSDVLGRIFLAIVSGLCLIGILIYYPSLILFLVAVYLIWKGLQKHFTKEINYARPKSSCLGQ